ncbi:Hypothetical_protein [Hexamita inflata]|uniref:Hypothetical_protein n=1 Tax=Hexamita inflata TaxID=28002 RepID=A0AA86PQS8_9EUKA|nr:Hypothetical protein HINF_LOCUS27082 [Hexamita inflata]
MGQNYNFTYNRGLNAEIRQDDRSFKISNQSIPSQHELRCANNMRHIESPNIQLKYIQNKRKSFKTKVSSLQQEINVTVNKIRSNQIQFTVIGFFQQELVYQ